MPATPAQTSPAPIYDGHNELIGVWGGAPQTVPATYAHSAFNRFFRGDRNLTRPRIRSCNSVFETEADRIWFEGGNGQGMFFYNGYPSTLNPKIIVSISGKIFAGVVLGPSIYWSVIFDGNSRVMCNTWFAQGFEWLFIQDGIHEPVFWNGVDPARRSDPTKGEMPIGSVMAYIHGRMTVASADGFNTVSVGDIVYANSATDHSDILLFTEQDYWAEGGSFDIATNLGDILGLYAMPWLDTGTGANELVALCQQGFTSFDLSAERVNWIDQQPQKISMIGQGCVSSIGFAGLNGDLFYRRADGIGSYRNARTEFQRNYRSVPISREVNQWLRTDRTDLLKFIPMVTWQNMVLTGFSPQVTPPNNPCAGYHRYCRGIVVLDSQSMSTTSREGAPVWHGAWTGIRPWGFAQGFIQSADRCFALSYDRDGKNRIYEFTLEDGNDLFASSPRKQFWRYDTAALGQVEARCSFFDLKKMTGGQLVLSGIRSSGSIAVQMFPDGAPCTVDFASGDIGCECPPYENCSRGSAPQWANVYLPNPLVSGEGACVPGTTQPGGMFHYAQVRVSGYGTAAVERMKVRMQYIESGENAACIENNCQAVTCCADVDDFNYHIAPAGENTEIPAIPCPVPPPPALYTSTRYFTAICASFPSLYVTAQGQATSTVSQLDADNKALAAAQANAQQQLEPLCPTCTPQVLAVNVVNENDVDYSAFFATGLYITNVGQPWRLIDGITDQYVAVGYVDPSGTLVVTSADYGYPHGTFDPTSFIYSDAPSYSGPGLLNLQLGCSIGGQEVWPSPEGYG